MAAPAGRVALVTGAGRGIGRATALALAERDQTAALVRAGLLRKPAEDTSGRPIVWRTRRLAKSD
jgi:NAD(P)-dependent dehydrogenase (short-subunit alcohol dehydrogenase family)